MSTVLVYWLGVPPWLLGERRYELAAEGRDVRNDAAPDQVSFAEGRLVHPYRPCVLQVVLYAQRARRPCALDYLCRDRDEPTVTDDADGLASLVHLFYEVRDFLVASELVRGPAAGDDDPVELRGIHVCGRGVCAGLKGVLAVYRFEIVADGDHLRPLLPQPHDRHPVLEVFEALGDQYDHLLPSQLHLVSFLSSARSAPAPILSRSSTALRASSPPTSRARTSSGTASAPLPERMRRPAFSRCGW